MPAKATLLPSGLKAGDSGASTVFSSTFCSVLPVTTFWTTSVFCFSVRTKYAMRSPTGAHASQGTMLPRKPPASETYSNPRSLSNPGVRFRMIWPSRADSRITSYSRSCVLNTSAASISPEADAARDSTAMKSVRSGRGARLRP